MVQKLLIAIILLTLSSCFSLHERPHTKYQRKNLRKFEMKKHMAFGKFKREKRFGRIGSYWHPAVPDPVRREMRARWWSKQMGEGKIE
jgi:hypothetical protein